MKQGISVETIMKIATNQEFFVDRYKGNAANLRKKCRKLFRDGALVLVRRAKDGFHYRAALKGGRG